MALDREIIEDIEDQIRQCKNGVGDDGEPLFDPTAVHLYLQDAEDILEELKKPGCSWCTRKPELDAYGEFFDFDNEKSIAYGAWTVLKMGVDLEGRITMVAQGDGRAVYYPKFCPECGRKL